ncbi:MAG: hypothetical protein ACU843_05800 [Gammaproteobacteria bacterium]
MRSLTVLLIHVLAAAIPFLDQPVRVTVTPEVFEWPDEIGGIELIRVELAPEEQGFYQDFPGEIGRFQAGDAQVVVRNLTRPSRKLHPAADCLRGSGYRVEPLPARRDADGRVWGCVLAEKDNRRLRACEQITDSFGRSWYDVSSWYWTALLGRSTGPWRAVTIAERIGS